MCLYSQSTAGPQSSPLESPFKITARLEASAESVNPTIFLFFVQSNTLPYGRTCFRFSVVGPLAHFFRLSLSKASNLDSQWLPLCVPRTSKHDHGLNIDDIVPHAVLVRTFFRNLTMCCVWDVSASLSQETQLWLRWVLRDDSMIWRVTSKFTSCPLDSTDMINDLRPSLFLPLFCFCVWLSVQTKKLKMGEPWQWG